MGGIIHTATHGSIDGDFWQFHGLATSLVDDDILRIIWCSILFCIWKARNRVMFENVNPKLENILDDIEFTSWTWLKSKVPSFSASFSAIKNECMPWSVS